MLPIHGAVDQDEPVTTGGRTGGSEPDSDASTVDLEQVSLPGQARADVSPH